MRQKVILALELLLTELERLTGPSGDFVPVKAARTRPEDWPKFVVELAIIAPELALKLRLRSPQSPL